MQGAHDGYASATAFVQGVVTREHGPHGMQVRQFDPLRRARKLSVVITPKVM